ncbi:long-chain fatty acid--CoA ligase [Candidatus Poribacteria bacterium]|nr:long-chain fatty acid--CoA ligase [Candidatus Poribacteria bacterium]MYH83584.1 long-chain fatty acid--CoA ligase [Candidatus Poribacteria bacterium]MYK93038.1 long-chain fatty acid--CoA ligase [Candidatus Poribacteria bacterium]
MLYMTLISMFEAAVQHYGNKAALAHKPKGGTYLDISYTELDASVAAFSKGLNALGVEKNDRVAILSENRPEWAITDFGSLKVGAVTVPMFSTLTAAQVGYILKDSGAKIICVSTEKQLEKVRAIRDEVPTLEQIVIFDTIEDETPEGVIQFQAVCELAGEETDSAASEDDIATIIYTSGTTGNPKGVMLTHANFISNVEACKSLIDVSETDVLLSFLPLSHVFERLGGHYVPLFSGAKIAYAESTFTVAQNMKEVAPTVMLSVPRLYETMHERILRAVQEGSSVKQKIFHWGVSVGSAVSSAIQQGRKPSAILQLQQSIADKLVFAKLKEATGGRLRFFVSGGAALPQSIAEFFHAAGILILEGYGLTETSPVISMNHPGKWKFGTVGAQVPGIEVQIAEDGEILTRGPHVMKGYFNNDAATAEVIDAEGWFHTGDIGLIDADGFVKITDRKKNIIVLSNGKNVAPQPIESVLVQSPFISQIMVIGSERKNLAALIVPNFDALKAWASENSIETDDLSAMLEAREVQQHIQSEIRSRLTDFADFEQVRRFTLFEKEFSQEDDEMTPTLKLKRNVIIARYGDAIEAMYPEDS